MRMFLLYVCTVHNNARFIFAIFLLRSKRVGAKFLDEYSYARTSYANCVFLA